MLNIAVTPERVIVATDSMVRQPARNAVPVAYREATKLVALAGGLVLAGRGTVAHMYRVYDEMLRCAPGDFDTADLYASSILMRSASELQEDMATAGLHATSGQEIALAGWSARRGRMVAVVYVQPSPGREFVREALDREPIEMRVGHNVWVGAAWPTLPRTPEAMVELSQHQHRELADLFPADPLTGGRLLVADLTQHGVNLQQLGDLGIPAGPPAPWIGPGAARRHSMPRPLTSPGSASLGPPGAAPEPCRTR